MVDILDSLFGKLEMLLASNCQGSHSRTDLAVDSIVGTARLDYYQGTQSSFGMGKNKISCWSVVGILEDYWPRKKVFATE